MQLIFTIRLAGRKMPTADTTAVYWICYTICISSEGKCVFQFINRNGYHLISNIPMDMDTDSTPLYYCFTIVCCWLTLWNISMAVHLNEHSFYIKNQPQIIAYKNKKINIICISIELTLMWAKNMEFHSFVINSFVLIQFHSFHFLMVEGNYTIFLFLHFFS